MFKRIAAALAATLAVTAFAVAPAQAEPVNPNPSRPARTWTPPQTHNTPRVYAPKGQVWVVVKPGQTLWRLAVIYRGNGHEWTTIQRLNALPGTTIYAGQRLRVR